MIIYLHGFNSSPQSHKARVLEAWMNGQGLASRFRCPGLADHPEQAIAQIEQAMAGWPREEVTLVGSSLGGFYATWFAEREGIRAVLINPAITPHTGLRSFLGEQQNLHSGARYRLTESHLEAFARLTVGQVTPERYLLIVETGDEVLDYRRAVEKYQGCRQIVVPGGDHALQSFPQHLPAIARFAGLRVGARS